MPTKEQILKGRQAVDTYRTAHAQLYVDGWHKGISEAHTPLLETMKAELASQGFTMETFWEASDLLNVQELGFKDMADFEAKATLVNRQALEAKWQ